MLEYIGLCIVFAALLWGAFELLLQTRLQSEITDAWRGANRDPEMYITANALGVDLARSSTRIRFIYALVCIGLVIQTILWVLGAL